MSDLEIINKVVCSIADRLKTITEILGMHNDRIISLEKKIHDLNMAIDSIITRTEPISSVLHNEPSQ